MAEKRKYLTYNSELAARVCELMIEGVSLRKICEMQGMPSRRAIFNWLDTNEQFRAKYELARQMQAEWLTHEILTIADDASEDFVINERGEQVVNHEAINRSRLRVDTRKWIASKILPRQYGDRVTADITMRDARSIEELSNEQLVAIVARGSASAGQVDVSEERPEPETTGR
jgi:hypothetical protein